MTYVLKVYEIKLVSVVVNIQESEILNLPDHLS